MTGKTHTIKRRLSVIALAASVAAIAIPAAQARNAPVDDWFRDAKVTQAQNILVDDWFRDGNVNQSLTQSVGAQDNEPSMCAVHLYPCGAANHDSLSRTGSVTSEIYRDAGQEHGSNVFLGQTTNQHQVNVRLPRADDPMFREIVQEAAQEHGATGFGNGLDLRIGLIKPVHATVVRDAGDATGSRFSLSWKPATVDYSHLPQEDRP